MSKHYNKTIAALFCIVLFSQTASADLTFLDTDPSITIDSDNPTYAWYNNLNHFTNLTYSEQITSINQLRTDGYAGRTDWHLASIEEMMTIWSYSYAEITTKISYSNPDEFIWAGRYEHTDSSDSHYGISLRFDNIKESLPGDDDFDDGTKYPNLGAWVVSTVAPATVPAPSALLLGCIGVGIIGRYRKRSTL